MIEKISLFQHMSSHELDEIERIIVPVSLFRDEFVFKQGDVSRDFYIIQNGNVELSIKDVFQETKSIAILANGEFFGEMALFDKDSARSLDAQVLQNTTLLKIPGEKFERLLAESPSISFKIMGALSKRLKEANERRGSAAGTSEKKSEGKVIVVASPRNGYGKTTFSTTLAHLLSSELGKRILYIDLDLYFGDGTFALGVFSPKSILAFAEKFKEEPPTWELFLKYLVKHNERLYILPAPKDFIEGEKVNYSEFGSILRASRTFFDYIVIDTDSSVNEVFLTAVDVADQILFLINVHCTMSIKSDVRYFRGISHLNLPAARCALVATRAGENFNPDEMTKLLNFKTIGALPQITTIPMDYGQSVYHLVPKGPFCESLRTIFKALFKETWLPMNPEGGFLYQLFFPGEQAQKKDEKKATEVALAGNSLDIANANSNALLSLIRASMAQGYWDKAFTEAMELLEIFPNSPSILMVVGEVCFYQKNYQLGIDALQKALNLDPENHYAMGMLGTIQVKDEMMTRSLELLAKKIQKNPEFPDLHNDLGKLAFAFKDFKKAELAFQKALELNPEFDEARVNLAVNYAEMANFPAAIEHLMMVKNKNIRIFYLLGSFQFSMGDFLASFDAYNKVADENPHYLEVSEKLESLRSYFKKITNLLKMNQERAQAFPDFPDLHCTVGNLLVLLGKHDEARHEFERALALNPSYQEAGLKLEEMRARESLRPETPLSETPSGEAPVPFSFDIAVEKSVSDIIRNLGSAPRFSINLKNIRTNKTVAADVPPDDFQDSLISFDCLTIGPVLPEDIFLVQVMDTRSNTVFATLVHLVTASEVDERKVKLNLDSLAVPSWQYHSDVQSEFRLPIHHFGVRIVCPPLSSLIAGIDPPVRADIRNLKNGITARGTCNSASPGETYFVLATGNGTDVVHEGDQLHLELSDRRGIIIFSMEFPVLAEDIDEFCKTVSVAFLEHVLQSTTAQLSDQAQAV